LTCSEFEWRPVKDLFEKSLEDLDTTGPSFFSLSIQVLGRPLSLELSDTLVYAPCEMSLPRNIQVPTVDNFPRFFYQNVLDLNHDPELTVVL